MKEFKLTIDASYDGKMIKEIYKKEFGFSDRMISKLKLNSGVVLNGEVVRVTKCVKTGDTLLAIVPDEKSSNITPTNLPVDIVYQDEDIMLINKNPNMPVHPSQNNYTNTLANALKYYWDTRGEDYIFRAVNRLDKDTSGLMLVAKNAHSHYKLSLQLQSGELQRKYQAVCHGIIEDDSGTIDLPIRRKDGSTIERCVADDGKRAVTHYRVLKRLDYPATLLDINLDTGRTHQIRVHFSHICHALLGDWLYGVDDEMPRQALHSYYIRFIHPTKNEEMIFEIPLYTDMALFVEKYDGNGKN